MEPQPVKEMKPTQQYTWKNSISFGNPPKVQRLTRKILLILVIQFLVIGSAFSQTETILDAPSTAEVGSWYGLAVSISDDAALVGAGREDGQGAVYIYEKENGVWTMVQRIESSDIDRGDDFGGKMAIDGTRALIGARYDDGNAGSVYVFDRQSDGTWTETVKLTPDDLEAGDNFGEHSAVDGDRIVIGSRREDTGGNDAGAAYVFDLVNGAWTQMAKLQSNDISAEDRFGQTVSVDGDRIVAGGGNAVYVFELDAGVWSQVAKLESSIGDTQFGLTVHHKGDRIITTGQGAAYVFELENGVWTESAVLTPTSSGNTPQVFGRRVALSGNRALVSAHLSTVDGLDSAGAMYLFEEENGVWTQTHELVASDAVAFDKYGSAISLHGSRMMSGAPGLSFTATEVGSAYIYELDETPTNDPTASFTYVANDLMVDFDGSGSTDDGTITDWDWDFGDGNSGAGEFASHTYATDGSFTVTLTVTDDEGGTDSTSETISVGNPAPVASFTATQISGTFDVDFDGSGSTDDGTITDWDWDFGDGNSGAGETITHSYASDGTYMVTLTVTDDGGKTNAIAQDVSVVDASGTMHVESITTEIIRGSGGTGHVEATITIHDDTGAPVEGATVTGMYSNDVSGTDTQVTDSNGIAVLMSDNISNRPTDIGICVDALTHATLVYDPAGNSDASYDCGTAAPSARGSAGLDVPKVEAQGLPETFALKGNYPNPFNPVTTIRFDLPESSVVRLEVYNLMGRRVATLVQGVVEAGRHEASWDATNMASGIYLYRLNAGGFEALGRMVLMK